NQDRSDFPPQAPRSLSRNLSLDSRQRASRSTVVQCFARHSRAGLFLSYPFRVFPLRRDRAVAFREAADRTDLSAGHRRAEANELNPLTTLQPPSRILLESRAPQVAASSDSKCYRNCHDPSLAR